MAWDSIRRNESGCSSSPISVQKPLRARAHCRFRCAAGENVLLDRGSECRKVLRGRAFGDERVDRRGGHGRGNATRQQIDESNEWHRE